MGLFQLQAGLMCLSVEELQKEIDNLPEFVKSNAIFKRFIYQTTVDKLQLSKAMEQSELVDPIQKLSSLVTTYRLESEKILIKVEAILPNDFASTFSEVSDFVTHNNDRFTPNKLKYACAGVHVLKNTWLPLFKSPCVGESLKQITPTLLQCITGIKQFLAMSGTPNIDIPAAKVLIENVIALVEENIKAIREKGDKALIELKQCPEVQKDVELFMKTANSFSKGMKFLVYL